MYEAFFGLQKKPFELVPNPDFLYLSRSHSRAGMYLDYAMKENTGFILLTGEVGAGKTTLIRKLLATLGPNVSVSKVFNTRLHADQLVATINDDFGLSTDGKTKVQLLRDLYHFLIDQYARKKRSVLIVDEAQNLSVESLEELRMLSNLETDERKLLQILLVGQPELKRILSVPELRQLRQRISIHCHINPLTREETEEYVLHRLEVAGNREAVEWEDEALGVVHEYGGGIPRLVNIICDFLLLAAYAEGSRTISEELVDEVANDPQFEGQFFPRTSPRRPPRERVPGNRASSPLRPPQVREGTAEAAQSAAGGEKEGEAAPVRSAVRAEVEDIYRRLDLFETSIREVCKSITENDYRMGPGRLEADTEVVIDMPDFRSAPPVRGGWFNGMKKLFLR